MPKQIMEINPFHGGLNSQADPRDIKVEELSLAQDIMVDEIGKVRMMGSNVAHDAPTLNGVTITPGYCLHYMSHDMTKGNLAAASAINAAETGDDYLFFMNKTDSVVDVYSRANDDWGYSIIDLGQPESGTDLKPCFYNVDGALRISDGAFGNVRNINKWYGYIDRKLMQSTRQVEHSKWYAVGQKIEKPSISSKFDENIASAGITYDDSIHTYSSINADTFFKTYGQIWTDTSNAPTNDSFVNIAKAVVKFKYEYDRSDHESQDETLWFDFKIGDADNSTTFSSTGIHEHDYQKQASNWGTRISGDNYEKEITYHWDVGNTDYAHGADSELLVRKPDNTSDTTKGFYAVISNELLGGDVSNLKIDSIKLYQAIDAGNTSHGLSPMDVYVEAAWNTASVGTGVGWDKKWNFGVSFVYDEKQESLIRQLYEKDDSTVFQQTVSTGNHCPTIKLNIGDISLWNSRITGINLYMREQDETQKTDWYLQTTYDLVLGKGKVYPNGVDFDFDFDSVYSEYNCSIARENLLTPNLVGSYETITGVSSDEKSISSRYKTAVVANRVAYIANIEMQNEDGTTEIRSDGMLKSNVNQFDVFPSRRIIEASVRDGDSIIALAAYADRILQFKEHKMHIINVSQEIEFLEETHMHKGIKTPASVAETDYGIAWVNEEGCYLYDGRQVHDLLEKNGMQIIKESDWATHIGTNPMCGYLPKKRQIIVVRTAGSGGLGDVYLYDIVTKSWVTGDSKFDDSNKKSNFVVDWNHDLIHAKTSSSNVSFKKWDDTSASGSLKFQTKDMTFGQPGQRKRLHKIYLTYKGDASGVTCKYATNGESDVSNYYQFSGSDTPLLDKSSSTDWTLAELKPTSASQGNNIYSAKFYLSGSSVPSDFEINDINIVFRMKNVK